MGFRDINGKAVKNLREFQIPYVGLKIGVHHFEYHIDKQFFKHFEDSPIADCKVHVRLELEKKETLFLLRFYIDGTVNATCDRCLEPFDKDIFADYQCLVKFSEELAKGSNDDDEIIYIAPDADYIEVSQLIYEYINLSLPMQLMGCKEPGKDSRCNKAVIEKLLKTEAIEIDQADPRWEKLGKLKFDKN